MNVAENPFTPTFGITPPLLVGRDAEVAVVRRALRRGPGDPARAVLLTGSRGSGKTVLLNALEDEAAEAGWVVISEIVQPGLARELTRTVLPGLLAVHDPNTTDSSVTGVTIGALGVSAGLNRRTHERHPVEPSLRSQLERLAGLLAGRGSGVFLSLDEVHRDEIDELKPLFHAIQQGFRRGLPVAFAAAGLPSSISRLLSENVLTYLRRAERFSLGGLSPSEARAALQQPIVQAGRTITPAALDLAAAATQGYPYLVQVVGFELWQVDPSAETIDLADARVAIARARRTAHRLVHEPTLADLSEADRAFLEAMAEDASDPSSVADILTRLGATRDHVNKYRSRLISAQIIEPAGRGKLSFAVPLLRDYLRQQSDRYQAGHAVGVEDGQSPAERGVGPATPGG